MTYEPEGRFSDLPEPKGSTPVLVTFKNGALVTMERSWPSGMYTVLVRTPAGEVHDKVRCDDRSEALAFFKCFKGIARNF